MRTKLCGRDLDALRYRRHVVDVVLFGTWGQTEDFDNEDFMDYETGEAPTAAQLVYGRDRAAGLAEEGFQFAMRGRQNRGTQQQEEKIVDVDFFNRRLRGGLHWT